jgi:hypothetical protein
MNVHESLGNRGRSGEAISTLTVRILHPQGNRANDGFA